MKSSIIRTKLNPPRIGINTISRLRLLERLESSQYIAVELISAPAGFGKTTLLVEWMSQSNIPAAWISIDEGDNDLRLFLQYVVAAIKTLYPDSCNNLEGLISAPNLPSPKYLADLFLNDLEALPRQISLILDDYHHITDSGIHSFIGKLFIHPSQNLRLFIVTRHDPPIPLASWRASGLLQEIRFSELALRADEVAAYALNVLDNPLSEKATAHITTITEGWAVGLHLLMLVLARQKNPDSFALELRGSVREINDYFIVEVLRKESPGIQELFLALSLSDRFCSSMIDVLRERSQTSAKHGLDGRELIEHFVIKNYFIISLDEDGQWYRFHHQFQDLLQRELMVRSESEYITDIHRNLSLWFESENLIDEAIKHAMRSSDLELAANIIERNRVTLFDRDRWHVVQHWLKAIPVVEIEKRPVLLISRIWILFYEFRLTEIAPLLDRLQIMSSGTSVDRLLKGEVSFFQGILTYWQGDGPGSLKLLEKALELFPESLQLFNGEAELYRGLARCLCGEATAAIDYFRGLIDQNQGNRGLYLSRIVGGQIFIFLLQAEWRHAIDKSIHLEFLTQKNDNPYTNAFSHYLNANASFQLGEWENARIHFEQAIKQRFVLHRQASEDAMAMQAFLHRLMGRRDESTAVLEALQTFKEEMGDNDSIFVKSCKARIALLEGDVRSALTHIDHLDLIPSFSEMFTWLEVPSITQARCLIATGKENQINRGLKILDAAGEISESCKIQSHSVDLLIIRAIAHSQLGQDSDARRFFKEALLIASAAGFVRPFVEAGRWISMMLKEAGSEPAFKEIVDEITAAGNLISVMGSNSFNTKNRMAVSLTNRELDVLELIVDRYRDKEIADKLSVSLETVRTHLKHIFRKLETNDRRQAADRAVEMGIITRS